MEEAAALPTAYCAKSQPIRNASYFGILEAGMVVALGHHLTGVRSGL
jgi:hypothetical protein